MSSLIKPLFRLMVGTFIFAMLMPVSTTRAGPDCTNPKHAGHPNCPAPDPPPPSVTYTAQLTGAFPTVLVDVSPNEKENTLFPNPGTGDLVFNRPSMYGTAQDAWDAVFNDCFILGPTGFVFPSFTVSAENLSYQKPGGVQVALGGIEVLDDGNPFVGLHLVLIGDVFFDEPTDDPFVPAAGDTSTFMLTRFWLTGHTVKGIKPRGHCNKEGRTPDLGITSTLVITATTP